MGDPTCSSFRCRSSTLSETPARYALPRVTAPNTPGTCAHQRITQQPAPTRKGRATRDGQCPPSSSSSSSSPSSSSSSSSSARRAHLNGG
ncbi:hypothetical protein SprV_0902722800 [Sparganum proliferum]